jgi:RHS repeat-associated protein
MTGAATGGASPSYQYSGDGLEASATSGTSTAQLTWDRNGSLPVVLSDGTNYYLYGPSGEPVEQVNVTASPPANNPLFLTYTPSDSSWLVTNSSGQEMSFYRYDAFGTLALGTPDSPFGYAGQYGGTSSGGSSLDNMQARWYQAGTGQFTSVDPAFDLTDQGYAYANGDPVNESDPSGLKGGGGEGAGMAADAACGWDGSNSNSAACLAFEHHEAGEVAYAANSWNRFIEAVDPGFWFLMAVNNDVNVWENPCSSGWQQFLASLGVVANTVSLGSVAAPWADGILSAGSAAAEAAESDAATMGGFTESGSTIHDSPTATAIGDDPDTLQNLARSQGAAGHDVIVHGELVDGEGQFIVDGNITNPQQIADAVLSNSDYVEGTPINLVTCYGGCGPAQELSEILGVPVNASQGLVDLDPETGLLREWP